MNPPGEAPWTISCSKVVLDALREVRRSAHQGGIEPQFLAALREINDRLRFDPHIFGEPYKELRAARLQLRLGVIGPLSVVFGVHEEQHVVFVRGFVLLPPAT
jgi:hypothetical protein